MATARIQTFGQPSGHSAAAVGGGCQIYLALRILALRMEEVTVYPSKVGGFGGRLVGLTGFEPATPDTP